MKKSAKRSALGERILTARQTSGLSQTQLAEKLGVSQQMVGYLELEPVAIRPELLAKLSEVLAVPVEQLLGIERKTPRASGPVGKARQIFERVSKLPRATQQRILANVEDALTAHDVRKAG
jgi:transcriptional regulator with XRE-family HTH domain